MFEKLRNAFSNTAKSLGERELKEKDIEDVLFELEISLLESDVATEVIDTIKGELKERLIGSKVNKSQTESFVKKNLIQTISVLFDDAGRLDLLERINKKKDSGEPYVIMFVGINGTGKTTTLAKLAHLLKQSKYSVVVAASDTFRAGAIEQLREHTTRVNVKLVAQNYGSDPAAVARDAVLYAKSHKVDCVLIDTAGRMQTSKNLMDQISKIAKVVKPDLKIFVGDSLAGNDTVSQAREFFDHVSFDASILTKSDADARGGAALSIVKITKTPILFVGMGQEYDDLKPFDKDTFLETVFGPSFKDDIAPESLETPKTDTAPSQKDEQEKVKKTDQQLDPLTEKQEKPQINQNKKLSEITTKDTKTPDDPFEGISDEDINRYSELYDIPPPETDYEAKLLSDKIRNWIDNGKPAPEETPQRQETDELPEELDKKKDKKKRSIFGLFRK